MTIADKLSRAKEDYGAVHESGKEEGYQEGYSLGHDHGEQYGKELGKQAEYDAFWDLYQNGGKPKDYSTAFGGVGWTEQTFKPKYDIVPTNAYMMFRANPLAVDLAEYLNGLGVTLDLSQSGNTQYMFQSSKFTRIGVVDVSGSTNSVPLDNVFASCSNLVTIDKLVLKTGPGGEFNNTFGACPNLENLTIDGVITKNGLYLQTCTKLSRASITSVIRALSPDVSGQTVTLSRAAVENAFENNRTTISFDFTAETDGADVTLSDNGDGTVTMNGSVAFDSYFLRSDPTAVFSAGSYTLSLPQNNYGTVYVTLYDLDGKEIAMYDEWGYGEEVTFTANEDFVMKAQLYLMGAATFDNAVVAYPTIRPDFEALKASKPNWTIALV